jgi:hypothetical protein
VAALADDWAERKAVTVPVKAEIRQKRVSEVASDGAFILAF